MFVLPSAAHVKERITSKAGSCRFLFRISTAKRACVDRTDYLPMVNSEAASKPGIGEMGIVTRLER